MKKLLPIIFSLMTAVGGYSESQNFDINNLPPYFKDYKTKAIKLPSTKIMLYDKTFNFVPFDLNEDFFPDVIELYSEDANQPLYYCFIIDKNRDIKEIFYDEAMDGLNSNETRCN